ncbi:MAG: hypothetical protein ACRD1V_19710 [Vicinamibacterales bacterium]
MFSSYPAFRRALMVAGAATAVAAGPAFAQATGAAASNPDDTPSIKVGATIFADYTVQQQPKIKDAAGDTVTSNSFNVSRAYVNVTGNVSHLVSFRITTDVTRDSGDSGSINGSYVVRLKYAFAQINLDHVSKGSWARIGQQQTPFIDYIEGIYRYRFQGPTFADREGFLTSSDPGASLHLNFPQNYGDIHVGVYNGEGYNHPEANSGKSFQVRGTVRPFPKMAVAKGWRLTGFYDDDRYVDGAPKRRAVFDTTFEHKFFNAGFDYLSAKDQTLPTNPTTNAHGYDVWLNPRSPMGVEALFRYDHLTPNTGASSVRKREIAGIAYWFPHQGGVSSAIMFDVDNTNFDNFSPSQPTQRFIAVHTLVNF